MLYNLYNVPLTPVCLGGEDDGGEGVVVFSEDGVFDEDEDEAVSWTERKERTKGVEWRDSGVDVDINTHSRLASFRSHNGIEKSSLTSRTKESISTHERRSGVNIGVGECQDGHGKDKLERKRKSRGSRKSVPVSVMGRIEEYEDGGEERVEGKGRVAEMVRLRKVGRGKEVMVRSGDGD